jgi:hypothetical protein
VPDPTPLPDFELAHAEWAADAMDRLLADAPPVPPMADADVDAFYALWLADRGTPDDAATP